MSKLKDQVRQCSIADALSVVGERWALLIVRELLLDNHRFGGIAAKTGAPSDVLSARLKKLTEAGVIERRRYSEHPPRDEYFVTESGAALQPAIFALQEWGLRHAPGEGPTELVPHGEFGHDIDPVTEVWCRVCGETVCGTPHERSH